MTQRTPTGTAQTIRKRPYFREALRRRKKISLRREAVVMCDLRIAVEPAVADVALTVAIEDGFHPARRFPIHSTNQIRPLRSRLDLDLDLDLEPQAFSTKRARA